MVQFWPYFSVMDMQSIETTIVIGQNMQMFHSLRCKLLADNMESLDMSSRRPSAILVLVFHFCNYLVFCLRLLLSRRGKLR